MPSSVRAILAAAGLASDGWAFWGEPLPGPSSKLTTGVYVVTCTNDDEATENPYATCPLSRAAVSELLAVRPELRVDGKRPEAATLRTRLAALWLPDEPILYVGLAGARKGTGSRGELAQRVVEYWRTRLGARSPHAGGWPLKTLAVTDELVVHYAYCEQVRAAEQAMLSAFASGVSQATRVGLHDSERVMPFANLEHPWCSQTSRNHRRQGAATICADACPVVVGSAAGTSHGRLTS